MKKICCPELWFVFAFFLLLASGCVLNTPITSPPPVAATATLTQIPTEIPPTPSPLPSETPPSASPTSSPQPQAVSAVVNVDVINLRDGPGTVFKVMYKALKDTPMALLGIDPGKNWVLARFPSGSIGWVSLSFITPQGDPSILPVLPLDYAYTVSGSVVDTAGAPIEGLTVAIYQQVGSEERRTDTITLEDGKFTAFLPITENGTWNVEVVGISCTSRIVDADCNYTGRFEPMYTKITLPEQSLVEFVYNQK